MIQRPDPFDRLRMELGRAAEKKAQSTGASVKRRWRWATGRTLALAAVGLLASGIATAAVVTRSTTSELSANSALNAPAAENLRPLLNTLRESKGKLARRPLSKSEGQIRGTSMTRGAVTVDVAISSAQICIATRTAVVPHGSATCSNLPIRMGRLPFVSGADSAQAWLAMIVPDGVSNVRVRGDDGNPVEAVITDNIALAIVPGARRVAELAILHADGTTDRRRVGSSRGSQPGVRHLRRP